MLKLYLWEGTLLYCGDCGPENPHEVPEHKGLAVNEDCCCSGSSSSESSSSSSSGSSAFGGT